ncbi:MAG: peptide ABC transporter ATP-binding protein, partial [Bacillota bacterium]|nr:peptide ABC transporter ATP-binding protein [Bacillota bacterium]
ISERSRKRISYNSSVHNYADSEELAMREVTPGHFVLCSEREFNNFKK